MLFVRPKRRDLPISLGTKVSQGIGIVPSALKELAFQGFLLLYYNQVLGLPAFYTSIALGIALQKTNRQVWCLDGDGAALMHLGSIAINGSLQPKNLKHIILNNGAHDSVGGQPTVGFQVDFLKIAQASGYQHTSQAETTQEIKNKLEKIRELPGLSLLEIRIKVSNCYTKKFLWYISVSIKTKQTKISLKLYLKFLVLISLNRKNN